MLVALPPNIPAVEVVQTSGMSAVAQNLDDMLRGISKHLRDSVTLDAGLHSALLELEALKAECAAPNWDGYGANALDPESHMLAKSFLENLPLGIIAPSIAADPDGQVTVEWYKSSRSLVSISFDPVGILHYASIIGSRKANGSEPFIGSIPRVILDLTHKVPA